jgi:hypothetical protein
MRVIPNSLALALIEGGCFNADQNIPRREIDRFDEMLGRFMAAWAKRTFCDQDDIYFIANGLFLHCGKGVLQRFCIEAEKLGFETSYNFDKSSSEIVRPGHVGLAQCPLLDPYDMARGASVVGWEYKWNPFRNASDVLWTAGWKNISLDSPKVLDARKFLQDLQSDLLRRGTFTHSS